jgi:hypothetical protein
MGEYGETKAPGGLEERDGERLECLLQQERRRLDE